MSYHTILSLFPHPHIFSIKISSRKYLPHVDVHVLSTVLQAVQVYLSWEEQGVPAPKVQLAWFDRLTIPKGGSKTVTFTVEAKTMALWVNNGWKISSGKKTALVEDSYI